MDNIKHPKMITFMPEVIVGKIKLALDSKTGRTKLFIPGQGEILGRFDPPDTPAGSATTVQKGIQSLSKTVTSWGQPSSMLIEFKREPECYPKCNQGISLTLIPKIERPMYDADINNKRGQTHSGEVHAPILNYFNQYSHADLDSMVSQILSSIKGSYQSVSKKDYMYNGGFTSTIARKVYRLDGLEAGDNANFKDADGTVTTEVLPTMPTTAGEEFNDDYILFMLNGKYYITSKEDFKNDFTIYSDDDADGEFVAMLWVRSASAYVKLAIDNYKAKLHIDNMPIDSTFNVDDVFEMGTYEGDVYVTEGPGKYPVLTAERINEMLREWNGSTFAVGDLELAPKGQKYVCYEIEAENEVPNLHGASHKNGYKQRLMIIALDSEAGKDVWASGSWDYFKADEAPTTPAVSLDTLLSYYSGTATSSWK